MKQYEIMLQMLSTENVESEWVKMKNITTPVQELVQDVLATMKPPHGEDIIEDVCLAIEANTEWKRRYDTLCRNLRDWVVNNWIGQYTKILTGMKTIVQVDAKRAKIIKSYSKLTY